MGSGSGGSIETLNSDSKQRVSRFWTRLGLGIVLEFQRCLRLGLRLYLKTVSFWSQTRNRVSKVWTRETQVPTKQQFSLDVYFVPAI